MRKKGEPSIYDLELADVLQDRELRKRRLLGAITGNGLFSEDEYADLVAREVEKARQAYATLLERRQGA